MSNITTQTRKESYKKLDNNRKRKLIYECLENGEYTARELAIKMHNTIDKNGDRLLETEARQEVAPRLTELEKLGLIETVSKKQDNRSGRKVAVYRKNKEGVIKMGNTEKDIKFIEEMIKEYKTFGDLHNADYEDTDKIYKALENMLEKIKELEAKLEFKKYGDLDNIQFEEYMNQFIPKQKVKDKIEELKKEYEIALEENSTKAFILKCKISALEELLEEK